MAGGTTGTSSGKDKRVRSENWTHSEILLLIDLKQKEIVAQKQLSDPRSMMIPAAQKWKRISDQLHAMAHSAVCQDPKSCKDKWNGLNSEYKKVADYHKGTGNHSSFWELSATVKGRLMLPKSFNKDFYEAIEAFQGERQINAPTHLRDSQADSFQAPSTAGWDSNMVEEPPQPPHPVVDLEDESQNVIHLTETPTIPANNVPPTPILISASTPGSTQVKRKRSSVLSPVLQASMNSTKVLVDALDRLNKSQLDVHKQSAKKQLMYLQQKDKKSRHLSKKMVGVLNNMTTTLCHAFIKDASQIPPAIHLSQSSDENFETGFDESDEN